MTIIFSVPGEPQGKGRPRFTTRSGYAKAYTPDATAAYEDAIRWAYRQVHGAYINGPVSVHIEAVYGIPKSASKAKRAAMLSGEILPCKKPDADNIAKVVCDALNGLAYKDDCQVVNLSVRRRYGDMPGISVGIEVMT